MAHSATWAPGQSVKWSSALATRKKIGTLVDLETFYSETGYTIHHLTRLLTIARHTLSDLFPGKSSISPCWSQTQELHEGGRRGVDALYQSATHLWHQTVDSTPCSGGRPGCWLKCCHGNKQTKSKQWFQLVDFISPSLIWLAASYYSCNNIALLTCGQQLRPPLMWHQCLPSTS